MDQLVVVLQQQGFTQTEAQIYLSLIQYGGSAGGSIARVTGINRATVYTALAQMKKAGFVHTLTKNDVAVFYPTDYKVLLGDIEKKYTIFKDAVPQLESLANQFTHQKAKLEYYDGEEGVKKAFEMTLQSKTPLYAFLTMQDFNKRLEDRLINDYRPRRVKKGIKAYSICDYGEENIYYKSQDEIHLKETRFVDKSFFRVFGEICLFDDDKVIHVNCEKGVYYATLHISEAYYKTMYSLHQYIWQGLV